MKKSIVVFTLIVLASPQVVFGKMLLDFGAEEYLDKDTTIYNFSFSVSEHKNRIVLNLNSHLEQGRLTVWFGGGGYEVIGNYSDSAYFSYRNLIFGPLDKSEPIQVKIITEHANGSWHISFKEVSRRGSITSLLVSGILMIAIAVLFMTSWRKRTGTAIKWILFGGVLWAVGVFLKFLFGFLLNAPILQWFQATLGKTYYLPIGSIYIGLLTGVFEIGVTLVFALLIKSMYEDYRKGIGIGIGAGGIEALLIGFSQIANTIFILSNRAGSDAIMTAVAQASASTPELWLIGPVERVIAILCHTSSRALVLLAVLKRKSLYFWAGFLIMTVIDAIAGYVHLAGLLNRISMWWVELVLLPFALISILIIKWCIKNWHNKINE